MKIPKQIRTYCKKCRKHTEHNILKLFKKGKESPFASGVLRHKRKIKGYTSKVAGKKTPKKRGKHQRIVMECTICKKKSERIVGGRTQKILEIIKK